MGFKVDASFLRYVTMGARGTRHVIQELRDKGFAPIELERYSTSNKIWSTKIKRLRLPDLLCVQTGLRVEVRAKTDLEIRMSHAPKNPDRHWDSGLRNEDVIALVPCDKGAMPKPMGAASYFQVEALRASVDTEKLSAMKGNEEGSEQYLEWPTVVSRSRPGQVLESDDDKLVVNWTGDGKSSRRHTYKLNGKHSYVEAGQSFEANVTILAGTPSGFANLDEFHSRKYHPLDVLHSPNPVDRYAAVKAIGSRDDLWEAAQHTLEAMVGKEENDRVKLEAAGTAAMLDAAIGMDQLNETVYHASDAPMRMETVLVATELGKRTGSQQFADFLLGIAKNRNCFAGDEVRQAAVWGLGRAGMRRYDSLLELVDDPEDQVALHAIAAYGSDATEQVVGRLIAEMKGTSIRKAAAYSEALLTIGGPTVLRLLIEAAHERHDSRPWVLATLGRMDANAVRGALAGDTLLDEITPLLLASSGSWLSTEEAATSLRFLLKQYPNTAAD